MKTLTLVLALFWFGGPAAQVQDQDPGGQVSGQIQNLKGKAASEIRVVMTEVWNGPQGMAPAPAPTYSVITDKSGSFRFENVYPGRYYILAGRVDAPTYYPGKKNPSDATIVTVNRRSSTAALDFQLVEHPGATVSGHVDVDWHGDVSRQLTLFRTEPRFLRQDVSVKPDGSFIFYGVPPGSYDINAYPAGIFLNNPRFVVKDDDVRGIQRTASAFFPVRGSVELEGGGPLPRLTLQVRLGSRNIPVPIILPQFETVFYTNMPAGELRISSMDVAPTYRVQSFKYRDADFLKKAIRVSDAEERFELKLSIAHPEFLKRIRGHVRGMDRLPNVKEVRLSGTSLLTDHAVPIQSDGSYEFSNVPPGTYAIHIARRERATVRLMDKDLENVDITLPVVRRVRGQLVVEGGGPLPTYDFEFDKIPEDHEYRPDQPDGTFEVLLPDGDVRIKVFGFPDGYELQSIRFGETDALQSALHIDDGDLPNIVMKLRATKPAFKVFGRLRKPAPVMPAIAPLFPSNNRVALSSRYSRILLWVPIGTDDSFEFPNVPAGIYTLTSFGAGSYRVIVEDKDVDMGIIGFGR